MAKVKIKKKRKGNFVKRIRRQSKQFEGTVGIGIFKAAVLKYALAHEFGARIKVTQKMRNFFRWKASLHPGVWKPLKKSTKEIVIPKRSYLGNFINQKKRIRPIAISFLNDSIIKGRKPKFDKYINRMVKENKAYYRTIKTPPKTDLAKFQSGTNALLRGQGDSLYNAIEGKLDNG